MSSNVVTIFIVWIISFNLLIP